MLTFYYALLILHYNARKQQNLYQVWPKCNRPEWNQGLGYWTSEQKETGTEELSFLLHDSYPILLWKHCISLNKEALSSHIQFYALETLFSALRPLSFLLISDVYSNNPEDGGFPSPTLY